MLALMLYAEARRAAAAPPAHTSLDRQETADWDLTQIDDAEALLHAANAAGPSGRYQIEAAIQSAHVARRLAGAATWPAIVALYDRLLALTRSPVVALNRAVALAETEGPAAALAILDTLAADPRMGSYQPYWAARGHLAARAGDKAAAYEALTVAVGLSTDAAVRLYLQRQLAALNDG